MASDCTLHAFCTAEIHLMCNNERDSFVLFEIGSDEGRDLHVGHCKLQQLKRSMTFSGSLLNYNMVRSSIDNGARIHPLGKLFNLMINNKIRSRAFAGRELSFTMICFNF